MTMLLYTGNTNSVTCTKFSTTKKNVNMSCVKEQQ